MCTIGAARTGAGGIEQHAQQLFSLVAGIHACGKRPRPSKKQEQKIALSTHD